MLLWDDFCWDTVLNSLPSFCPCSAETPNFLTFFCFLLLSKFVCPSLGQKKKKNREKKNMLVSWWFCSFEVLMLLPFPFWLSMESGFYFQLPKIWNSWKQSWEVNLSYPTFFPWCFIKRRQSVWKNIYVINIFLFSRPCVTNLLRSKIFLILLPLLGGKRRLLKRIRKKEKKKNELLFVFFIPWKEST